MIAGMLVRGLAAGLIAGLLAAGFGFAVGEPQIQRAIAVEQAAHNHVRLPMAPLVSRDGQRAGLILAGALYGLGVGGLFALGFAVLRGRLGRQDDWSTAIWLAAALFLAIAVVPALKYPGNPPGVGNPATISSRTELYLVMVATSLLALLAAWRVAREFPAHRPGGVRQLAGAACFVASVAIAFVVLPTVHEVPPYYPADLLWSFRVTSLGVHLVLWSSLGALFGLSCERWPLDARRRPHGRQPRPQERYAQRSQGI
jgi:putative cobalt transporter subunit CbtA